MSLRPGRSSLLPSRRLVVELGLQLGLGVLAAVCLGCVQGPEVIAVRGGDGGAGTAPALDALLPPERRGPWRGHVGVPGGIEPRPLLCANVREPPYGARADGVSDDSQAIQAAIDACGEGQTVLIPRGTYRLAAELRLDRPGITLRGEGPDQTTLLLEGGDNVIGSYPTSFQVIAWRGGYAKGSTTLTLERTDALEVGQELLLDQLNDPLWVRAEDVRTPQSCGRSGSSPEGGRTRVQLQLARITRIDGLTVEIDPPLYRDYQAALSPEVLAWSSGGRRGNLRRIGVEDLRVDGSRSTGRNNHLWQLSFCSYCWIKNLEVVGSGRAAVSIFYGFRSEIRDSYFHDGRPPVGPERFGVRLDMTSGTLVENNVFRRIVSPVMFACPNSGAVVAFNYAEDTSPGATFLSPFLTTYAAHNDYHLVEGNVAPLVALEIDSGSASHVTLFRNRLTGFEPGKTARTQAVVIEAWNRSVSLIGNVLGTAGHHRSYQSSPERPGAEPPSVLEVGFWGDGTTGREPDFESVRSLIDRLNRDESAGTAPESGDATGLPPSLYLDAPPPFWAGARWPAVDPGEVSTDLPAERRARSLTP